MYQTNISLQNFSRRESKINCINNNNNTNNEYKSKIFDEISILMRAFGDISDSSLQITQSIVLVEKILIQQLKEILEYAMNNAQKRSGSFLPNQLDFELLMHKNKAKLVRFRKYMRNIQKIQCKNEQKQQAGRNYDINFLNRISEENKSDDEDIYDAENMRRLYRADRISQILSVEKYEEFQKARSWSSNVKNKMNFLNKLIDILQLPKEMQEDSNCLEIIQFLTQETVATLVDYSILTRLSSKTLPVIDQTIVQSNLSNNMFQICPEVTQGRAFDGLKPLQVQEIQEAMRRFHLMRNQRKIGFSQNTKAAFLAL